MIDSNKKSKLENLKQLYDSKAISETEYNVLKEEVLFNYNEVKIQTDNQSSSQNSAEKQKPAISTRKRTKENDFIAYILVFCFVVGFFLLRKSNNSNDSVSSDISIDSTTVVNDTISYDSQTICKVCGTKFYGDGYDRIDGVWQKNTSMQTELCSPSCARKESERMDNVYDDILEKHGYEKVFTKKCTRCGSDYVDGFCERCGAASAEKVYESYSNRPNCDLCNGNGYIHGGNGNNLICPSCNGTGKFSH